MGKAYVEAFHTVSKSDLDSALDGIYNKLTISEDLSISEAVETLKNLGHNEVTAKILRDLDSLVSPQKERNSGYRVFSLSRLKRISFILTLKQLGLSTNKIRRFLELDSLIAKYLSGMLAYRQTDGKPVVRFSLDKAKAARIMELMSEYMGIIDKAIKYAQEKEKVLRLGNSVFATVRDQYEQIMDTLKKNI